MGRAVWDAYELYLCRSRLIWFLRCFESYFSEFFVALNGGRLGYFGYLDIWLWIPLDTVLSGFGFLWLISLYFVYLLFYIYGFSTHLLFL